MSCKTCNTNQLLTIIANIATRLTDLENNLRTFAEQTEQNTCDLVLLDERTQMLNVLIDYVKEASE